MNNTINSDLIRGNIDTIILRALYDGDRYGYDIIKEIEQRSGGKYKLKQPTLYSCLNRLENQGFVHSYWGEKSIGGRRKYYTLTDMGKELFVKNKTDWQYSKSLIDDLIIDDAKQFEHLAPAIDDSQTSILQEPTTSPVETAQTIINPAAQEIINPAAQEIINSVEATEPVRSFAIASEPVQQVASEMQVAAVEDFSPSEEELAALVVNESENTDYLDSLYETGSNNNYITKLCDEVYTPDKNIYTDEYLRADNYFRDFDKEIYEEDDEEELEEEPPQIASKTKQEQAPSLFRSDNESRNYHMHNDNESRNYHINESHYSEPEPQKKVYRSAPEPTKPLSAFQAERETKKTQQTGMFLSYKTTDPKSIAKQQDHSPPASEELYRFFEEKMASVKRSQPQPVQYTNTTPAPPKEKSGYVARITEQEIVSSDEPEFVGRDQIQIRNFKKLQESAAILGEDIKIRSYESASSRQFNQQYYYYANKLKLPQYFALFCFFLLEVVLCYALTNVWQKQTLTVPTTELVLYVFAVIFGMAFPTTAFLLNITNPNKRSRIGYSFKTQLLFSILVMILLLMIIYLVNVSLEMPLIPSPSYYTTLFLPAALTLNLPINAIIFKILFCSKKYAV